VERSISHSARTGSTSVLEIAETPIALEDLSEPRLPLRHPTSVVLSQVLSSATRDIAWCQTGRASCSFGSSSDDKAKNLLHEFASKKKKELTGNLGKPRHLVYLVEDAGAWLERLQRQRRYGQSSQSSRPNLYFARFSRWAEPAALARLDLRSGSDPVVAFQRFQPVSADDR
jgi:hypothetical protein